MAEEFAAGPVAAAGFAIGFFVPKIVENDKVVKMIRIAELANKEEWQKIFPRTVDVAGLSYCNPVSIDNYGYRFFACAKSFYKAYYWVPVEGEPAQRVRKRWSLHQDSKRSIASTEPDALQATIEDLGLHDVLQRLESPLAGSAVTPLVAGVAEGDRSAAGKLAVLLVPAASVPAVVSFLNGTDDTAPGPGKSLHDGTALEISFFIVSLAVVLALAICMGYFWTEDYRQRRQKKRGGPVQGGE